MSYLKPSESGLKPTSKEPEILNERLSDLEKKIHELTTQSAAIEKLIITPEEKDSILKSVTTDISQDTIKLIFTNEALQMKSELKKTLSLERIEFLATRTTDRIKSEIIDQRKRSNLNLFIGVTITIIGVSILASALPILDTLRFAGIGFQMGFSPPQPPEAPAYSTIKSILPFIPRLSLALLIEIFAYFFLRLYKSGLSDIKYFQNELTNIESKLIAIETSFLSENEEPLKTAINSLSNTERNFILEKGQSTLDLEKSKAEYSFARAIIKIIPDTLKNPKQ